MSMASTASLTREEKVGLLLAGAAHVALAWMLITQRPDPVPLTPPERITVSLAEDVGLDSTAPDPSPDPAAAMAPDLAPLPVPPVTAPPVRPSARPTPTPRATRTARPTPTPTATRSARPTPTPTASATRAGAGRINENFLDGTSDATGDRGQAADRASPQQQASIAAAVIRQLKPHWNPPSGVDVDRLVTVVRFRLNRDGSLNGSPEVVRQTGINDNNRLQAPRHAEQALRAVRLAAGQGFDLPAQFYSEWDVLTSNFDNRLAQ